MTKNYIAEATAELADKIQNAGYRVFLAESKTYGFYTDAKGSRVVCFKWDFGPEFSGNYITNAPARTGTGWGIEHSECLTFTEIFNATPPYWAINKATWRHTTMKEHMNAYQASSRYTELS